MDFFTHAHPFFLNKLVTYYMMTSRPITWIFGKRVVLASVLRSFTGTRAKHTEISCSRLTVKCEPASPSWIKSEIFVQTSGLKGPSWRKKKIICTMYVNLICSTLIVTLHQYDFKFVFNVTSLGSIGVPQVNFMTSPDSRCKSAIYGQGRVPAPGRLH